ncbi:hypothetical protein ACSNOH_25955 [Streptomyces sp. URMC 127]|uniref:hypothetical protein n=1 Tax=Streptomyces sp. URMC 127 TaxID=3423402 RepID=UPI003F1D8225
MVVREQASASRDSDSAEADRAKAEGAAEGRLEAEHLAGKKLAGKELAGNEPDNRFADPPTSRSVLSLSGAEEGVATLTARGGNAIPKGIRVVDESGTLIAAYIGFALDDLSVAKSARSAVAGALALSLDSTDEKDEAKAASPSGVIAGQVGEDIPVELTPGEFRDHAVTLFAGELIDVTRELRASGPRRELSSVGETSQA